MTRTRRTARQDDVLRRLVSVMAAEGFAHLTLDDIAQRLRCSKTTLYQLAASKQELVVEVIKQFFRDASAEVEARVRKADNPREQVVSYLDAVADRLTPLSRTFLDDLATLPAAAQMYRSNTAAAADRVRDLIADGISEGAFRAVHPQFVAEMIAATMFEIQRGEISRRTGMADSDAYRELASLVLFALQAEAGRPARTKAAVSA